MNVDVRWYDADFMLRGYCFDQSVAYISYFLREGPILSGRYNPIVKVEQGQSPSHDLLLWMFIKTFNAFFELPGSLDPKLKAIPFRRED